MTKRVLPKGFGDFDLWASRKRVELDAVLAAASSFALGCAYTPCYKEFDDAHTALKKCREMLTRKNWKGMK